MPLPTSWTASLRAALGSLKLRITLGVTAALVLGIGLSTVLLVRQVQRDTLAAMRDRELGEAVRTAHALSRRVVDLQRSLQLVGGRLDPATLDDDEALSRFLTGQPVLLELFSGLYVIRPDGSMRMALTAEGISRPALNVGDRAYFQRTLREQRAIVSEPMPSRLDGAPLIVFSQPLRNAQGLYGVLAGALNLAKRDLLSPVVDQGGGNAEALRVVSDAGGRILAHPNPALVMAPLSAEPRLAGAAARWRAGGSSVEPAGLMLSRDDELVSVGGVAGPDWMVWRAVDQPTLLAPLHAARRQALSWAAALILSCSTLLLLCLWWLLQPLRRLTLRAEHLFDGAHDAGAGWPDADGEIGGLVRVLRQVGTDRARLELTNNELLQKLGSVMRNAPVGITFTRAQRFELVSAEFCRLLGRSEAELLGKPTVMIYDTPADYEALAPKVDAAFASGEAFVGDVPMRRADGTRFWAHLRGRPVDMADSAAGTIWTVTDVTHEVAARTQLEWSASHDPLTGLANRKVLEQRLAHNVEVLPASVPAALVMIDLDHFKPVNDRAGHAAGDAMLQAVAAALRARVRSRDLAVRLGGDEFALLLEHCPLDAALLIAEDVRAAICDIVLEWGEHRLVVGVSLGVAVLTADTASTATWLRAADEACYSAKAAGRGRVEAAPLVRPALRIVGS